MTKFYLTTAIDYSNGDPHLGHALEKVGADCIARYRRLRGDQVHFLMGMDEHSQSVIQAAARGNVTPRAWVDRMAGTFADYWRRLECSNDDWIRTTEPRHVRGVVALLERIQRLRPADLYVADYEGLYCTGCEEFKSPAQIANGHCIEHPTLELIPTKERNHFFRLSAYGQRLLALIASGEFRVEPAIRRNEVVRLLEDGPQDVSISRQRLPWGIPFPGDSEQTVYVWFDALINYLSATGFPEPGYDRLWPADLHVVGKGITRFHCVIWPAMLLAADLALPRLVWAHGYVQWEGAKMSKTAGTAVSVGAAIERHGADALRPPISPTRSGISRRVRSRWSIAIAAASSRPHPLTPSPLRYAQGRLFRRGGTHHLSISRGGKRSPPTAERWMLTSCNRAPHW